MRRLQIESPEAHSRRSSAENKGFCHAGCSTRPPDRDSCVSSTINTHPWWGRLQPANPSEARTFGCIYRYLTGGDIGTCLRYFLTQQRDSRMKRFVAIFGAALLLAAAEVPVAPLGLYTAGERRHWAFQPRKDPRRPPSPTAADKAWVKTPVDAFILGRPQEGRPETRARQPTAPPSSAASPSTSPACRPRPRRSTRSSRDKSPDAWEKVVDRLLASPHYGEQWGRHWLDVVRFAESDGYEYDMHRPDAWRYRDYVVQSFNDDKPYNEFVKEQLAGDEMDSKNTDLPRRQRLQPPRSAAQERRQPGRRQFAQRSAHRDDQHRGRGVPRRHGGLRALPRSQVRSLPPVGLLPPAGPLRADPAQRPGARQQGGAGCLEGQGRARAAGEAPPAGAVAARARWREGQARNANSTRWTTRCRRRSPPSTP